MVRFRKERARDDKSKVQKKLEAHSGGTVALHTLSKQRAEEKEIQVLPERGPIWVHFFFHLCVSYSYLFKCISEPHLSFLSSRVGVRVGLSHLWLFSRRPQRAGTSPLAVNARVCGRYRLRRGAERLKDAEKKAQCPILLFISFFFLCVCVSLFVGFDAERQPAENGQIGADHRVCIFFSPPTCFPAASTSRLKACTVCVCLCVKTISALLERPRKLPHSMCVWATWLKETRTHVAGSLALKNTQPKHTKKTVFFFRCSCVCLFFSFFLYCFKPVLTFWSDFFFCF